MQENNKENWLYSIAGVGQSIVPKCEDRACTFVVAFGYHNVR